MPQRIILQEGFFSGADRLRREFEARFAQPRRAKADRFVWDPWVVPDQYSQLRTPAWQYFSPSLYQKFHRHLVNWGRKHLGCHDISPPWLSCYTEGHFQNWHADQPHGPWAFVYSLTDWRRRKFTGGETEILRDETLDYWQNSRQSLSTEFGQLVETVAPQFNRLIIFDPRIPHRVSPVRGVIDPRQGRLVIHGWFVQPRLFVEGPLAPIAVDEIIRDFLRSLSGRLSEYGLIQGALCLRFKVSAAGEVREVKVLTNTLRSSSRQEVRALRFLQRGIGALKFPRRRSQSSVTLPVMFD